MSAKYLKEHYVYGYYDEQGQIYYVGKGKGKRYKDPHDVIVPPIDRIKFFRKDISDQEACELEQNLIKKFGRKDLGTGILENRSDKDTPFSPITIKKLSLQNKERSKDKKWKKMWLNRVKESAIKRRGRATPSANQALANRWKDPEFRKRVSEKIRQSVLKNFKNKSFYQKIKKGNQKRAKVFSIKRIWTQERRDKVTATWQTKSTSFHL